MGLIGGFLNDRDHDLSRRNIYTGEDLKWDTP